VRCTGYISERHNLSKLTQEEIRNLNRPTRKTKVEALKISYRDNLRTR
jgi:hypothetical protein